MKHASRWGAALVASLALLAAAVPPPASADTTEPTSSSTPIQDNGGAELRSQVKNKVASRRQARAQRHLRLESLATRAQRRLAPAATTAGQRVTSWGPRSGSSTLVLFDTGSEYGWLGELYAQGAGNLATHFGRVTAMPVVDYRAGQMGKYDAVVYLGSTYNEALPEAFIADVNAGSVPVLWAGFNIWQLAGADGSPGDAAFIEKYGWDVTSSFLSSSPVTTVSYKGTDLRRHSANAGLLAPRITDPARVSVVAKAVCGESCDETSHAVDGAFPWAVRSANLTYIGEIPLAYMGENDRYLAFADLLYALHGRQGNGKQRAAIRLEDISPNSDPADIREKADYLASAGVPFSMAVIPVYKDPLGAYNDGVPQTRTLAQSPKVVAAIKYALKKGGTLVQHGTTHQYGTLDNPYNGVSGDDFEFFRARCTTQQNGTEVVPCSDTAWVTYQGSVPQDSWLHSSSVIAQGRLGFLNAGLPLPTIFEFPHYAASDNAYSAASAQYGRRYERVLNHGGQLLPALAGKGHYMGQFFPYSVTTLYGDQIIPENLGNYEPDAINNNQPRLVPDLLANGSANLVMTDPVASLFFHPYLPVSDLRATVEGLKGQGYTFVSGVQLLDRP